MKKYLLYSLLGATALFTAACDEDFNEDVVPPQEWEQEEIITLPGLTATGATEINLGKIEGDSVSAFSATINGSLPEGAVVKNYRIALTAQKEGASAVTFETGANGNIAKKDLQEMIEKDFGKRPVFRTYDAVVYAIVMTNGQASLMKSETTFSASPKAPFISSKYYLIGDVCGWDAAKIIPFNHSDKDVYEDPIFTLIFTTTAKDQYWKIVPQTNVDKGNVWTKGSEGILGVADNGDASADGQLITAEEEGKDVGAARIENPGMYRMTLNMMDYTYSITAIAPEYYIVGAMQGWNSNAEKGMTCTLYPTDAMHFSYTTKFEGDGNLKIWLGSEFGNWDKAMGTAVDGDQSPEGKIGGGGAIKCPEKDAFYTFSVDFSTNTYKWTKLGNQEPAAFEKIGLIGSFNSWGGDAFMTLVSPHNWYLSGLEIAENGEIKFRANADWGTNWGTKVNIADQSFGVGTNGGANINIPTGTYNVFFNDITGEFVFKKL